MKRLFPTCAALAILSLLAVHCGGPAPVETVVVTQEVEKEVVVTQEVEVVVTREVEVPVEVEVEKPADEGIVDELGEGDIQLVFWNGLTGSDGLTMVEMVKQFTIENPNISVRMERMPWMMYFPKLLASLVAGNPPDLFLMHNTEMLQFATRHTLRDLSDMYTSGGGPLPDEDFLPQSMGALSWEGKIYGVPLDYFGLGMWVNCDLFEEAGLDCSNPPASGEQFIEWSRKLTLDAAGKHPDEEGFDPDNIVQWGTCAGYYPAHVPTMMWQFGGDWTDGEGNATINQEAAVKGIEFWYDLIYEEHVAPLPGGFDSAQSFAAGTLAMMPDGSWFLNFAEEHCGNYAVWPYPRLGDSQETLAASHVMYMPASLGGEKAEAVKLLIEYLSNDGLTWATSGMPPARISQMRALDPEEYYATKVFADSLMANGRYPTTHEAITEIEAAYVTETDAALNDVKPLGEAMNDANEQIQSILDRYK